MPRGLTIHVDPAVRQEFSLRCSSVASALRICLPTECGRPKLRSSNDVAVVGLLEQLRCHFRDERVLLLGDGRMSHCSRTMNAYVKTRRSWRRADASLRARAQPN